MNNIALSFILSVSEAEESCFYDIMCFSICVLVISIIMHCSPPHPHSTGNPLGRNGSEKIGAVAIDHTLLHEKHTVGLAVGRDN